MNIFKTMPFALLLRSFSALLLLEASNQAAKSHHDVMAMVEICIRYCGSIYGKREIVKRDAAGSDKDWRVRLVFLEVEKAVLIEDLGDNVGGSVVIVHCVGVDRKVRRVVSIGPVQPYDGDSSYDGSNDGIYCNMVGDNKGIDAVCSDVPIKGGEWVKTESLFDPGDGGKVEVRRRDPSKPVEKTESFKNVVGKPEPD